MGDRLTKRRAACVAVALVIALAAVACESSSKSSTAAKGTTTSTTPTASSADTVPIADAPTNTVWLCKPGVSPDPCAGRLDSTSVTGTGATTVKPASVATDPKIDCFYVYPTVSQQTTVNANLHIDPAETGVAIAQASRFSQVCHVYAPMYRQLTLSVIGGKQPKSRTPAGAIAYGGRAERLARLPGPLQPRPGRGADRPLAGRRHAASSSSRSRSTPTGRSGSCWCRPSCSAATCSCRSGKTVGGSFTTVPACTKSSQTGCVVAYSSFLDPPPANSLFGRSSVPGDQVLCTNPAALGGGTAVLHPEFPTREAGGVFSLVTPAKGVTVSTPWVNYPDLYKATCVASDGSSVLHVTPTPAPGDPRPVVTQQIGATWGLHLVDVNIAYEDLVDLVRHQVAAYGG